MIWNPTAASDAGTQLPEDIDALIDSCAGLTGDGKSFFAIAGSAPPNVGLMAQSISATRVYAETPDWNEQRADGSVTFADSQGLARHPADHPRPERGRLLPARCCGRRLRRHHERHRAGDVAERLHPRRRGRRAHSERSRASPSRFSRSRRRGGGEPYILASPNYAIAITAASDDPQKQAAQAFLDWLAEPENAAKLAEVAGNVPVAGLEDATLPPQYEPVKTLIQDGDFVPLPANVWPNPGILRRHG